MPIRKPSTPLTGEGRTLERVRREAVRNGYQRIELAGAASATVSNDKVSNRAKYHPRDPQPIGAILGNFYATKGVSKKLLLPQITESWEQLVGSVVAEHTTPKSLEDEVLRVEANSSVWAAQLTALSQILINKINTTIGSYGR